MGCIDQGGRAALTIQRDAAPLGTQLSRSAAVDSCSKRIQVGPLRPERRDDSSPHDRGQDKPLESKAMSSSGLLVGS